jgi:hypothetical protein
MAGDKRADISVSLPAQKVPLELKRDYHRDVWSAAETQLDRFYTRDPDASGFDVYAFSGSVRGGAELHYTHATARGSHTLNQITT